MNIPNEEESNHQLLMFNGFIIDEFPTVYIPGVTMNQKLSWITNLNTMAARTARRLIVL